MADPAPGSRTGLETCCATGQCPLCLAAGPTFAFCKNGYRYWRCASCGHIFVYPLPSEDDTIRHYQQSFTEEYLAGSQAWFSVLAERRADLLPAIQSGRLLDVGSGYGHFLEAARRRGWKTAGIDYSGHPVEYSRRAGHEIFAGDLLSVIRTLPSASRDVITFWHVLEHLEHPRSVLEESLRVLAPEGLLYLNSPNIDSAVFRLIGRHWSWVYTPGHVQYFHRGGLQTLLESWGIQVISSQTWTDAPNLYFLIEEAILLAAGKQLRRVPLTHVRKLGKGLIAFAYSETNHKQIQAGFRGVYDRTPGLDRWLRRRRLGHEFLIVGRKNT